MNPEIVEYWETENLPSSHKTSVEFRKLLESHFTPKNLDQLFKAPFLPRAKTETLQLQRIKEVVKISYDNVPFYKNKYSKVGFLPGDLKTWKDYHSLPYVTKEELIDAFPERCVNNKFKQDDLFPTRSSGSSGSTLRIYVDPLAIAIDTLQGIRQFWLQSNQKYSKNHIIANVYTVPWWVDSIRNKEYQNIFISSLIPPKKIGSILESIKPDILSLYPSNLESIIPHLTPEITNKLFLIVTHSEMSNVKERRRLSELLKTPVLDEYSSEELTRIALELPDGHYHLCEDTVRLDILNPESMKVVDDGTGMVVATNLLNTAMPFIRYLQGDYVTIDNKINSDVTWRQIRQVDGRLNDSFIKPDGQHIPAGTILDITYRWMYDIRTNIEQFEIIQMSPNKISVIISDPKLAEDHKLELKSKNHLKKLLTYVLGTNIELNFSIVERFPHTTKKRRPIRREF